MTPAGNKDLHKQNVSSRVFGFTTNLITCILCFMFCIKEVAPDAGRNLREKNVFYAFLHQYADFVKTYCLTYAINLT